MPKLSTPRGITVTANNTIQIAFTWRGRHFRERLPLSPTVKNLDYAARKRAAILYEIETGTFDFAHHFPSSPRARTAPQTQPPRVGDALRNYLRDVERHCAHSTARDYASAVHTHLLPAFGDRRLDALTVAALREFIRAWPHSHKRLRTALTPLRHVLADAYADGVVERDPFQRLRLPSDRHRTPAEPDPFTPEELQDIVAACPDAAVTRLVRFAASTGLRISELIALEWSDVDFSKSLVRVQRAVVRGRLKPVTKTPAGDRAVTLLPTAATALIEEREAQARIAGRIWRHPRTGRPYPGDAELRALWQSAVRRAGVRYRPPQQLRHTYASWLLTAGEDPSWIARQMGHADWAMIRRVYARWIPQARPEAGERAAKLLAASL